MTKEAFPVFTQRWDDFDEPFGPDHEKPRTLTDYAEDVIKAANEDVFSQEFEDALKKLGERIKMHREAVARIVQFDVFDCSSLAVSQVAEGPPKKIAIRFNTEHNDSGFNWRVLVDGEPELLVEQLEIHTIVRVETFNKVMPDETTVLKGNIVMYGYVDKSLLDGEGRGWVTIFGKKGPIPHEEDLAAWIGECHYVNQELLARLDKERRLAKENTDG